MSVDTKVKELIINTLSPEQLPENPSETEIYLVEDDAEYATVEELATKQDKLTAGQNISITNNVISATNAVNSVNGKTGTVVLSGADINATVSQQTKTVQGHLQTLSDSVQDIEKSKFIDATIMGTPTINNGQVSNFSSQSYLILPFAFDPKDRAFEINMAFTTGSNVTSNQNLLGGNYCIALLLEGGVLKFRASNNGTSWNVADITTTLTVQPNTNYFVRVAFNKLNYTISYSTNGEDYTQIGRLVSTLYPRHGQVFIGVGNNQFNPFLGIINLNKTNIKLNNSVIWQGMDDIGILTRADISLSNLDELGEAKFTAKQDVISDLAEIRSNASTGAGLAPQVEINTQRIEDLTVSKFPNVVIVGTPHIEGGQVSNYSNANYLQFPFVDISRGLPFDIYFSFTTGGDVTTQQNVLDSHFGIALAIQNGKGIMALSSNGTNWDIGTATGTNTLLPNTTYYVKYSWTGTAYSAALSTNDETYVPDMNLTSSLSPHKTTIFIGGSPDLFGPGTAHPFKGTINFNKSKVVVNNITVWEGMADVGLASRANVSLNNLDAVGQAKFDAKQDVISDLATIRSNASSAKSTVDTHVANGTIHVTANDKIAWSNKQNKLTAGANINIDESTNTISATGVVAKGHEVIAFQAPTAGNGYTWYRKYADGWVEQGGWKTSAPATVTFPVAMSLTNQYTAIAVHNGNTEKGEGVIHCYNKTSTKMDVGMSISSAGMAYFSWFVAGMAA